MTPPIALAEDEWPAAVRTTHSEQYGSSANVAGEQGCVGWRGEGHPAVATEQPYGEEVSD
jgi:hypothetical protein